ncbi:Macrolide-specific efflux protein MacA [Minicystis rosea]|nr:Macrolide-specific efflux protein MacA [Minicystis rosea]
MKPHLGRLFLAGVVLLAACKRAEPQVEKPATEEPSAALTVHFQKIVERKLPPTITASGTLAADETSEVASPGPGVVMKVEVDVGSRVKRGDVLVQIDPRDPSLKVQQANAATAQAFARLGIKAGEGFDAGKVADVRAAKEAMDLAVADADRTKRLVQTGSVSEATWDQARTRAEQARAQYDAALNGAQQAYAALLAAQAQAGQAAKAMSDTAIRAPFDGAVAERRISPGEYAQTGRVVAVVVRDNPLRLRLDVPEVDAGRVAIGQEVLVTVASAPGKPFHGIVKRVGASVRQQSRALPVEAEVPNDDARLKAGFFARAEILLPGGESTALLVPRSAIGTTGVASRIFVRAGSRVVERLVTVGREVDGLAEIRGTVAVGEEVALESVDKLSDGAEVKVAP